MKITPDLVLFHGSADIYSNWNYKPFEVNGRTYVHVEQYMMAVKARLFKDYETEEKIFATTDPGEAKKLGRAVDGYVDEVWCQHREAVVLKGAYAKFSQNEDYKIEILRTGARHIVEASRTDTTWGVGLDANDPRILVPSQWRGANLLGNVLMRARTRLQIENPLFIASLRD